MIRQYRRTEVKFTIVTQSNTSCIRIDKLSVRGDYTRLQLSDILQILLEALELLSFQKDILYRLL